MNDYHRHRHFVRRLIYPVFVRHCPNLDSMYLHYVDKQQCLFKSKLISQQ